MSSNPAGYGATNSFFGRTMLALIARQKKCSALLSWPVFGAAEFSSTRQYNLIIVEARALQRCPCGHNGNIWLRFPSFPRGGAQLFSRDGQIGCGVSVNALNEHDKSKRREDRTGLVLAWLMLLGAGLIIWGIALRGLFPLFDIVSPLGPHALAAAAFGAIALMLSRWRTFFLLSALGAILVTPSLLSLVALEEPGERRQPWHDAVAGVRDTVPQLRVLSINTWHSNGDLPGLARYIVGADADVVVLAEFGPNKQALLSQLKAAYPYQVSCAAVWACSQALLSRMPFVRSGARLPTLSNPPIVWAQFHVGTVDVAKLTVIGTHIYRPSRRYDWHLAQLAGLASHVRKTDGSVIVAGDFNMTRMSQSFDDFTYASGLDTPERLLASWPAWPVPLPQFQLDYVFVSHDLEVLDQRLGHMVGSDHLPLWTSVRLPQRASIMAQRVGAPIAPVAARQTGATAAIR